MKTFKTTQEIFDTLKTFGQDESVQAEYHGLPLCGKPHTIEYQVKESRTFDPAEFIIVNEPYKGTEGKPNGFGIGWGIRQPV